MWASQKEKQPKFKMAYPTVPYYSPTFISDKFLHMCTRRHYENVHSSTVPMKIWMTI